MVETLKPKGYFDRRSFRTVAHKSGARVTIGCRKGYWSPSEERCKVGTEAARILRPNPTTWEESRRYLLGMLDQLAYVFRETLEGGDRLSKDELVYLFGKARNDIEIMRNFLLHSED